MNRPLILAALLLTAACHPGNQMDNVPGNGGRNDVFAAIGPDEVLNFTGTEPFWGGTASSGKVNWTTPEVPEGEAIAVTRFAGRGGLSFSGTYKGADFVLAASQASCSDGMSDRTYPFTVTVKLGGNLFSGCGWTARMPFAGPPSP